MVIGKDRMVSTSDHRLHGGTFLGPSSIGRRQNPGQFLCELIDFLDSELPNIISTMQLPWAVQGCDQRCNWTQVEVIEPQAGVAWFVMVWAFDEPKQCSMGRANDGNRMQAQAMWEQ
jgi:hypothetical protein